MCPWLALSIMFLLSLPSPPKGGSASQKVRERQRPNGAEERSNDAYTILLGDVFTSLHNPIPPRTAGLDEWYFSFYFWEFQYLFYSLFFSLSFPFKLWLFHIISSYITLIYNFLCSICWNVYFTDVKVLSSIFY